MDPIGNFNFSKINLTAIPEIDLDQNRRVKR